MILDPLRLLVVMNPLLCVSIGITWALLLGFVMGQTFTNRAFQRALR